jgi:branched-chain amino acid transport system permease protein
MDLLYKIFIDSFVQMAAPDLLVQTLWDGFVAGALYALVALGFVLIFKASGVFNFAQGIMVVFAALRLVGLHERGVPAFFALGLTIVVMLALATGGRTTSTSAARQPVGLCSVHGHFRFDLFPHWGK